MEELLIENVKKHTCIYNIKVLEYRDSHMRQTAWEKIGKELEISASEAKNRWEMLRRCFCNAINRRREETRSGVASERKTLWKYELQMNFLIPFIKNRKTHNNLSGHSTEEGGVTVSGEIPETEASVDEYDNIEIKHPTILEEQEQPYFDAQIERTNRSNRYAGKRYETLIEPQVKKRQKSIDSQRTEIPNILKENSDCGRRYEENTKPSSMNIAESMDETDMFFLSMSRMTKQLPKVKQAEIKLAVSNAVLSAEIMNEKELRFQRPDESQQTNSSINSI